MYVLPILENNVPLIDIHATVEEMKQAFHRIQSRHLEQECLTKPKLRTFIQVNNLNRSQPI